METARHALAYVTTPAPDDDAHLVTDTCTPKQELFAKWLAETGNQAAAYRKAYNVHERTLPGTVWASASRVAALPQVRARVRHYQERAALETVVSIREALQWQLDIATADPNEIVRVVARCCRCCHGRNFRHQWKDEAEFLDAQTKALDAGDAVMPSDEGGYGFNGSLEPNPICPACYGVGIEQTIIADTTKLTGKARKLYAGAKQDRFGAIEVKLHDQKAAWEMVCRMLGAFNDKLDLRTPEERAKAEAKTKLPENVTPEQAAKAYLQLLG
jgi:phage terminase small subunit